MTFAIIQTTQGILEDPPGYLPGEPKPLASFSSPTTPGSLVVLWLAVTDEFPGTGYASFTNADFPWAQLTYYPGTVTYDGGYPNLNGYFVANNTGGLTSLGNLPVGMAYIATEYAFFGNIALAASAYSSWGAIGATTTEALDIPGTYTAPNQLLLYAVMTDPAGHATPVETASATGATYFFQPGKIATSPGLLAAFTTGTPTSSAPPVVEVTTNGLAVSVSVAISPTASLSISSADKVNFASGVKTSLTISPITVAATVSIVDDSSLDLTAVSDWTLYGESLYGMAKYSKAGRRAQAAPSFVMYPAGAALDYTTVAVSWSVPTEGVTMRLVRNNWSTPANQNDGQVLLQQVISARPRFQDGLSPNDSGKFLYYSTFVQDTTGEWWRGGDVQVMLPAPWGYGARMFALLPVYYQNLDLIIAGENQ